ncbi:MAG: phosphoglycolate phosphatase, partial [Clostridiales bacterium]
MHKIVLFDFDGTLFDTRSVDTLAVNALRDELGLSPLPDGEILSYVGQTNNAFITNCFGVDPKGDLTEISARFAYWE